MALVQETERKRKRSLKQQIRDNRRLLSRVSSKKLKLLLVP